MTRVVKIKKTGGPEVLEIENIKLQEMIKLYSDNIKEYKSSESKDSLTSAIETYINEIIPIQQKKRVLQNRFMGITKLSDKHKKWLIDFEAGKFISLSQGEKGKNRLIQKRNLFTDLEYVISKFGSSSSYLKNREDTNIIYLVFLTLLMSLHPGWWQVWLQF